MRETSLQDYQGSMTELMTGETIMIIVKICQDNMVTGIIGTVIQQRTDTEHLPGIANRHIHLEMTDREIHLEMTDI